MFNNKKKMVSLKNHLIFSPIIANREKNCFEKLAVFNFVFYFCTTIYDLHQAGALLTNRSFYYAY